MHVYYIDTPSGSLVCIRVNNLMIRGAAAVHMSPRLNFITGRNGTGKSRIVAAVQLALGSSSKDTGRSANLNEFICHERGVDEATVEVTLYNDGPNAFKPEVYGRYFTIRRTLRKTGKAASSRFTIEHTEPENVHSIVRVKRSKQSEITKVRDEFLDGVHVKPNNPMVILTQTESKKMLDSNDPESLFQIFLQATNLEKLGAKNQATEEELHQCNAELKDLKKEIAAHDKTIKELQDSLTSREQFSKINSDIEQLDTLMMLRAAQDCEKELNAQKATLEKQKARAKKLEQKVEELQAKALAFDEPLENKRRELEELRNELAQLERGTQAAQAQLKANMKVQFNDVKKKIKQKKTEIDADQKVIKEMKSQLQKERRKLNRASNLMSQDEVDSRLEEAERVLEKAESELPVLEKEKRQLDEEITELQDSKKGQDNLYTFKGKKIVDLKRQIKQSESGDPFQKVKQEMKRCAERV